MNAMSEDTCGADFLAGFFVGGLVGAALAIFFAPQSGKETQAFVRDKAIELREQGVEWSAEARRRAEDATVEARKRTEDLQAKAQDTLARGKDAATQQLETLKSKAQAAEEALAEDAPAEEPTAEAGAE
jgi:gas vesicle protein